MSTSQPTVREFLSGTANEKEFFARVFLPNRTVKTTHEHRLDDLNRMCLPFLYEHSRRLRILDVAVSSGVSTIEWHDMLTAQKIEHEMTATDLAIDADWRGNNKFSVLRDKSGNLLHFDMLGHGWPPHQSGLHFHAIRQMVTLAGSRVAAKIAPVKLVSRSVNGLKTEEDDISKPNRPEFIAAFDVIRAANILNLAYFPESTLRTMIANLKERLTPDGLLIICRTVKGDGNHGTIFQNSQPIARIGSGSEVEHLVNDVIAQTSRVSSRG